MPVARIQPPVLSQSGVGQNDDNESDEDQVPTPYRIDPIILEEINNYLSKIERDRKEYEDDSIKIEKLKKEIDIANELIAKAKEKKAAVLKRNQDLKNALDDREQRVEQALQYWKDYGLDVRQVSTDKDDFVHYEFIYSKPPCRQPSSSEAAATTTTTNGDNIEDSSYTVGIKFHNEQLQIVSQSPEILDKEQINELNVRIQSNCVNSDGKEVDYKSVMIFIRKAYIKNLSPVTKTS